MNCYARHGGTSLRPSDEPLGALSIAQCAAACLDTAGCSAFTVRSRHAEGDCWLRGAVELHACLTGQSYDTFVHVQIGAPAGTCVDTPPDALHSCAQQQAWGKCNRDWMSGFCCHTCDRCGEQGCAGLQSLFPQMPPPPVRAASLAPASHPASPTASPELSAFQPTTAAVYRALAIMLVAAVLTGLGWRCKWVRRTRQPQASASDGAAMELTSTAIRQNQRRWHNGFVQLVQAVGAMGIEVDSDDD